jgi:hypothetical protein
MRKGLEAGQYQSAWCLRASSRRRVSLRILNAKGLDARSIDEAAEFEAHNSVYGRRGKAKNHTRLRVSHQSRASDHWVRHYRRRRWLWVHTTRWRKAGPQLHRQPRPTNLPQSLSDLVDDLEVNMGGTSGALYCIFLSSLAQYLWDAKTSRMRSLRRRTTYWNIRERAWEIEPVWTAWSRLWTH